jgi:hypothetical protein
MSNLYRGHSIDASYHVSDHLAKRFHRRNGPIRNKNCLWRPYLKMDRNEMSTLHRGQPIDASYQDSVYLAKRFQKRIIFRISQSEISVTCGGHVRCRIGMKCAISIEDLP